MSPKSRGKLSREEKSVRIEAVQQGLRRFGLGDEWNLLPLFVSEDLPPITAVIARLKRGAKQLPAGLTAEYIAKALLAASRQDASSQWSIIELAPALPQITKFSSGDLNGAVREMIGWFRHFVEQSGGAKLIIGDEDKAQLLFVGCTEEICRRHGVSLDREVETGRGPVDFGVSVGFHLRTLIEMKRAANSRYWHGLENQLPTYLAAKRIDAGHFITIVEKDSDLSRYSGIKQRLQSLKAKVACAIECHVVDARPKPSASKLN